MTKSFVRLAALVFATVATFAQGTFLFNTFIPGSVDAPVRRFDGTGAGAGATGQMYLITEGAASPLYTALTPSAPFRTSSAAAAFYIQPPADPVVVPGIPAGQQATLVFRAWEGPSYEAALESGMAFGQSAPIIITLGGLPPGGGAPLPDALLTDFRVSPSGFSQNPRRQPWPFSAPQRCSTATVDKPPLKTVPS